MKSDVFRKVVNYKNLNPYDYHSDCLRYRYESLNASTH